MKRLRHFWMLGMLVVGASCTTTPPMVDSPMLYPPDAVIPEEPNPLFVPLGPEAYGQVFENALSTLINMGFEIQDSNRYDGRIQTRARIAPGLALFLKHGSPSWYERTLATLQTYRHRVSIVIQEAEQGGFFVHVMASKELEDLPKPLQSTVGAAIFRTDNNVDRTYEVVDPSFGTWGWIFKGRDLPLESEIVRRLKNCK